MSTKFVMQEDVFDCGLSALKTIFLQYGKKININIKNKNQGLSAYEIINLSKKNGLEAAGVKSDIIFISKNYLPCIAHIIKEKSYYHYIVILKSNSYNKTLTIFDPAEGIKKIKYEEFYNVTTNVFIIFSKTKFKKEHDDRFKKCFKIILKKNKLLIIKCIFISLISVLLSLVFSFYIKLMLQYYNYFKILSFVFLIISLIKNLFIYIKNRLIIKLDKKIDNDINDKVFTHIFNLPYNYYQKNTIGNLITMISDIENFKKIVSKIFILLFVDLIFILIVLIFLFIYNFYSTLFVLVFLLIKISISFFLVIYIIIII